MRYVIEIRDTRDSASIELWSLFAEVLTPQQLVIALASLSDYLIEHTTVVEVRINKIIG